MSTTRRARTRVGVTGLSGYLGRRVGAVLEATGYEIVELGREAGVELCDVASVHEAVRAARPQAIIHTAAANPGRDETTFDTINRAGAEAVARAAAHVGARLVHVSTDVVFDGRDAPYADGAPASPLNEYGRTKAAGERAVLATLPGAAVIRTSLIYGLHEPDRSTSGFIDRLDDGQRLSLFTDVIRQPVWVESLAGALVRLAVELGDEHGIINVAGDQPIDRASFGRRMLQFWGIDPDAHGGGIDEVQAADRFDSVPLDLRLDLERAVALGIDCRGVDDVLARHRD